MGEITLSFDLKEILLAYITLTGFISYIPQIVRLIKQKSSEDMSITTWVVWTINSGLYLLYLYLSKVTFWLIISQLIELTLIALTLLTILFFRFKVWFMTKTADKGNEQ